MGCRGTASAATNPSDPASVRTRTGDAPAHLAGPSFGRIGCPPCQKLFRRRLRGLSAGWKGESCALIAGHILHCALIAGHFLHCGSQYLHSPTLHHLGSGVLRAFTCPPSPSSTASAATSSHGEVVGEEGGRARKRERHRGRDRERQRETERDRDRETERERERQRQRQREGERHRERERDTEIERGR